MKLVEFIKEHENWEDLLRAAPYYITIKRKKFENCDHTLVKFCYDQRVSDFSNPIVRECRGVILEDGTWKVVARAMDKFGNYGEEWVNTKDFDWDTASVQEKIDGTLIMLYYYNGWRIGTRNTIDAFDAELSQGGFKSFGDLAMFVFKKELRKHKITWSNFTEKYILENHCYWFELVSSYNRVVIDYKEPHLYFLGSRNFAGEWCGEEWECGWSVCNYFFPTPRRYDIHTLEDCIAAAHKMSANEEGFVVCDKDFNRMKIKSPKYLELAYLHNNGVWSSKRMVEAILKGEEAEVLSYFPEWKQKFQQLKAKMSDVGFRAETSLLEVYGKWQRMENGTRADYAMLVKNYVPKKYQPYCFWYFDNSSFGAFDKWANKYLTVNKWIELLEEEN